MTDVYVVAVNTDPVEWSPENRGIYTDPAVAKDEAEKIDGWVETWELDNPDGHRTKTAFVVINDAPHQHNPTWYVREPRHEQLELSAPGESTVWQKVGPYGHDRGQVVVTAPTLERALEMMREAMDGYTPGGSTV